MSWIFHAANLGVWKKGIFFKHKGENNILTEEVCPNTTYILVCKLYIYEYFFTVSFG